MACSLEGALQGVITDDGRRAMAQSLLGPLVRPPYAETFFKYFKIGEGGALLGPGGSRTLKDPDPTLSDLEAEGDPSLRVYQKELTADKLTFVEEDGVPIAVVEAFVDFGEGNNTPVPEYFEIGLFDEQDVMLVYATFPGETKTPFKTLNHVIKVNF